MVANLHVHLSNPRQGRDLTIDGAWDLRNLLHNAVGRLQDRLL